MSNLMLGLFAAWAVMLLAVYLALHRSRRPRLHLRRQGAAVRYRFVRAANGRRVYFRCEILPSAPAPRQHAAETPLVAAIRTAAEAGETQPGAWIPAAPMAAAASLPTEPTAPLAPAAAVEPLESMESPAEPVVPDSAESVESAEAAESVEPVESAEAVVEPVVSAPEEPLAPAAEPLEPAAPMAAAASIPAAPVAQSVARPQTPVTQPAEGGILLEDIPIESLPTAPGAQARKRQKERRRAMLTAFVAVDAVLLICILFTVVHNSRRVASLSVSDIAESNTAAQIEAENKQAEKDAAAATPTPVPTPAQYADPLRPASNLGDAGEYVAGTWLTLGLQDADNSYDPSMTLSVADEGSGDQIYYQDRTPVDHQSGVSYCFSEPGRYIVTAYITAGDGTQSEYLTMDIKIYAQV